MGSSFIAPINEFSLISSFGRRRIPSPRHHLVSGPANPIAVPQYFHQAGESHRRAPIISSGRQIPSPRRNHFIGPANPIAKPQSFQSAGEFHRRAAIFSAVRRIPSPCHNHFSGPTNPIVSAGQRIPSPSRQTSSRPAQHRRAAILSWPAHHRHAVVSNSVISYLNLF